MGKWAKYSIYDGAGRLVVTFRGQKVKNVTPAKSNTIGFHPLSDAVSDRTVDIEVQCTCGEDHERHLK